LSFWSGGTVGWGGNAREKERRKGKAEARVGMTQKRGVSGCSESRLSINGSFWGGGKRGVG